MINITQYMSYMRHTLREYMATILSWTIVASFNFASLSSGMRSLKTIVSSFAMSTVTTFSLSAEALVWI